MHLIKLNFICPILGVLQTGLFKFLFVRRVEYPRCLCRGAFFLLSVLFVFTGSFYKLAEQRTGLIWTALEFWVELHTHEVVVSNS